MWKEFKSTISCELPEDATVRETWDSFVTKIKKKAEIEAGKEKITQMTKQHEEEILSSNQVRTSVSEYNKNVVSKILFNLMHFQ